MNNGYRKAALQLHGLSEADRNWILARLPVEKCRQLEKLIDELVDLGIPPDQHWLSEVPGDALSHAQELEYGPIQYAELEIESADISRLKSVMDTEPATVVELVLGYRDWSWRSTYFQQCEPVRRQRIAENRISDDRRISTKVLEALIVGLAERLANPEPHEQKSLQPLIQSRSESDRGRRFWRLLWQR